MPVPSKQRIHLRYIPDIKKLLIKAALKRTKFDAEHVSMPLLPNTEFYFDNFNTENANTQQFHEVVGWDVNLGVIHPCYLHKLAFPLHMMLLLLAGFPFPLIGLVHVRNRIVQYRAINNVENLKVSCCFGKIEPHSKGWLFSIIVTFRIADEVVWKSISTNLFRTKHDLDVLAPKQTAINFTKATHVDWQLNGNLGLQYAKVSGDFNPIHLTKWLAKLFGFRQHIIHGMWTKSKCVSVIEQNHDIDFLQPFEIETEFKQPLYLPNKVDMSIGPSSVDTQFQNFEFKVQSVSKDFSQGNLHLTGKIQAL